MPSSSAAGISQVSARLSGVTMAPSWHTLSMQDRASVAIAPVGTSSIEALFKVLPLETGISGHERRLTGDPRQNSRQPPPISLVCHILSAAKAQLESLLNSPHSNPSPLSREMVGNFLVPGTEKFNGKNPIINEIICISCTLTFPLKLVHEVDSPTLSNGTAI